MVLKQETTKLLFTLGITRNLCVQLNRRNDYFRTTEKESQMTESFPFPTKDALQHKEPHRFVGS